MTAQRKEKKVLIGLAVAAALFCVYAFWPRQFDPPLKGLGLKEPVCDAWLGACRRVTYTLPGDVRTFMQSADLQLKFLRYKRVSSGYSMSETYMAKDNSYVMIYAGRWKPWREEGIIDTFEPGWVTVTFTSPPDKWRQTWLAFIWRLRRPSVKMTFARKAGP